MLFRSPSGNVLTFVLSGGNEIDRKLREHHYVMGFLFEYKTPSNSIEMYNLIKDSCKHVSPIRKTKDCTVKAKISLPTLRIPWNGNDVPEGSVSCWGNPQFDMAQSDHIKTLKPQ